MSLNEVVMVSACRTAIGSFFGSLKDITARQLAIIVGSEAIKRAAIPASLVDEICLAEVFPHGEGSLPARQVSMRIGMEARSGAVNIHQNCASAMRALEVASHNIMLGKTDIALVVGTESMTRIPHILIGARGGYRLGPGRVEDAMLFDGLVDEQVPGHMGLTAENVAEKYGITREQCDELALISHQRAAKAVAEGVFSREIVPVEIKSKKGPVQYVTDEHLIPNASMEALAKLPSAFKKGGVVTAGNASGINDGAAAAILMSKKKSKELGITPLMKLVNVCSEGVEPPLMGLGPAVAIPKCLKQAGWNFADVEYWEVNEAFAAQWLGVGVQLKQEYGMDLNLDKVNHNGSGIALGHPVGCTGMRIIVSMYYEMERLGLTRGGASLCVGGGAAMASLWTRDV
ncbi:MAG: thiolase family protein [Syntrophomonadaceae bacterium]